MILVQLPRALCNNLVTLAVIVGLGQCGCGTVGPKFGPQGTFEYQRGQAVLHDPFPNNDVAPPIVGARPRGYDRPLSEAEANQEYRPRGGRPNPYIGF